jgi:PAS domain S-box-containing protein
MVEQRTAELNNSNILLENVFNTQQDALFILNDPSAPMIMNCNQSALRIFDHTREKLIRQPVEYLAAPAWINRFSLFVADYHQKTMPSPIQEFQMQTGKGRIFHAEVSVSPLLQELGQAFGSVLVIRDITRSKEALEAVKNSEQRLKLILDTVSDAFWDWQIDTGEVYFSSRYYTMLGYMPNEMPQSFDTWKSLLHPDDRVAAEETVIRHIRSHEPFEIEFRMKTKEGTYRWILGRGKTVEKDADGNARRMVGSHIDLTDRKNMEERLRHSQKMEAMGILAGGIAHDFNNILAAIVGYAELAIEEIPEDTTPFKRVNGILSASERARNLISQILTFSRKQDKNFQPMDIRMVLKEALGFMRASLPSTIQISEKIPSALPNIMGDLDQIQQMIINLITNASHAMKQDGTIHIEISCAKIGQEFPLSPSIGLAAGTFIKLTVSDTGCGIAPDILPKIFDPFFTTKEKGLGTGLGLATAHGIVKEHGGDISVESTPGFGTCFDVYLPVTLQNTIAGDNKKQAPQGGAERILIVDDEEVLPFILKDMLESLGYAVTTYTDSRQALEQFKDHPDRFDILLSDITMPHITGIEMTQAFQQIRPDIPVILWSGNNSYITEQKAIEAGAYQLLRKPFKRTDLAVAIRNALDKSATDSKLLIPS